MDAIDLLLSNDESGRWVHDFTLRGRRYTMRAGSASFGADTARLSVWNAAGKPTDINVRSADKVTILSRKGTTELYPTEVSA